MKTVTIGTIKGGDGKSSLCILLSRYLASVGKRVLTLDLDVQNSTSFSLLPDGDPSGRHIVTSDHRRRRRRPDHPPESNTLPGSVRLQAHAVTYDVPQYHQSLPLQSR